MLIFLCIVIFVLIVSLFMRESKPKQKKTVWKNSDGIYIAYSVKPPYFRNIDKSIRFEEAFTCGFCNHYESGVGCKKYNVEYSGVGAVVETVCDDFEVFI